jgi:adenine phosphoribosyltransferase
VKIHTVAATTGQRAGPGPSQFVHTISMPNWLLQLCGNKPHASPHELIAITILMNVNPRQIDVHTLWDEVVVVPDFPSAGISFKDLSGILANPITLGITINAWANALSVEQPNLIVGIEARGFPFGAALAYELGCGFVPLRKPGRLPRAVHRREYELEYGNSALELHQDALNSADRTVIVDDVLATGGTAAAAIGLVRFAGAHVISLAVVMDIPFLKGTERLTELDVRVHSLMDDQGNPHPHP